MLNFSNKIILWKYRHWSSYTYTIINLSILADVQYEAYQFVIFRGITISHQFRWSCQMPSSHWKLVQILADVCRLWGVSDYIPEFQSFFWQFQAYHLKETLFTAQKPVSFLANFNFKEPRNISRLILFNEVIWFRSAFLTFKWSSSLSKLFCILLSPLSKSFFPTMFLLLLGKK